MKKIKLHTEIVESKYVLEEEYEIEDQEDPQQWGEKLINSFNKTLRPHESPRRLVSVEVLQENLAATEHKWRKMNMYTLCSGNRSFDAYRCERCNITGKRFSLSGGVVTDPKYKGKAYKQCDTSIKFQEKKREKERLKQNG